MVGKNKRKRKYNYETAKSDENPEIDLSQLRKPIELGGTGVLQITNCLASGTEELCNLLLNECDIVYECKVCRNLFRSLANFIAHKRVYCKELFRDNKVIFMQQPARPESIIVINPESPPPMEQDDEDMAENVDGRSANEEEAEKEEDDTIDRGGEEEGTASSATQSAFCIDGSASKTHPQTSGENDANADENHHDNGLSDDEVDDSSNCSTATNSKSRTHSPCCSDTEVAQTAPTSIKTTIIKTQQSGPTFVMHRPMQPSIITSAIKQKLGHDESSMNQRISLKPIKTNPHAVYQKVKHVADMEKDDDKAGDSDDSGNSDQESDNEQATKRVRVTRSLSHDSRDHSPGGSQVELVEPEEATGPVHMSLRNRSAGGVSTPIAERLIERGDCDVKSRKCLKCNTTYASLKTLQFHMISLHSEKRRYFPCIYCDEKFSQLWGVLRHVSRMHKKTKEQAEKLRETLKRRSFMQPVDETEARILSEQSDNKEIENQIDAKPPKFSENRTVKRSIHDDQPQNSPKAKAIKAKSSSRRASTLSCPNCLKTFYSAESLERHLTFCFASNHVALGQRSQKPKQPRSRTNSDNSPKESRSPLLGNKKSCEKLKSSNDIEVQREEVSRVLDMEQELLVDSSVELTVSSTQDAECVEPVEVSGTDDVTVINKVVEDVKDESPLNRSFEISKEDQLKLAKIIDSEKMVCLKCHQSYSNISNLHRHGIRHLGWKRFKCRLCKYTSYNRSECKIHLRRVHLFQVQRNHLNAYVLDLDQEKDPQQPQQSGVMPEAAPTVPALILSRVIPVVSLKKLPRSMSVPGSMSYAAESESQPESPHSELSTPTSEHSTKSDTSCDRRKPSVTPTNIYRIVSRTEAKFNISTRKTPREFDMSPYRRIESLQDADDGDDDEDDDDDRDDEGEEVVDVPSVAKHQTPSVVSHTSSREMVVKNNASLHPNPAPSSSEDVVVEKIPSHQMQAESNVSSSSRDVVKESIALEIIAGDEQAPTSADVISSTGKEVASECNMEDSASHQQLPAIAPVSNSTDIKVAAGNISTDSFASHPQLPATASVMNSSDSQVVTESITEAGAPSPQQRPAASCLFDSTGSDVTTESINIESNPMETVAMESISMETVAMESNPMEIVAMEGIASHEQTPAASDVINSNGSSIAVETVTMEDIPMETVTMETAANHQQMPSVASVISSQGVDGAVESNDMPQLTLCTADGYRTLHDIQPSPPPLEPECMDYSDDEAVTPISGQQVVSTSAKIAEANVSEPKETIPRLGNTESVVSEHIATGECIEELGQGSVTGGDTSLSGASHPIRTNVAEISKPGDTHSVVLTSHVETAPVTSTLLKCMDNVPASTSAVTVAQIAALSCEDDSQNVPSGDVEKHLMESDDRESSVPASVSDRTEPSIDTAPSSIPHSAPVVTSVALVTTATASGDAGTSIRHPSDIRHTIEPNTAVTSRLDEMQGVSTASSRVDSNQVVKDSKPEGPSSSSSKSSCGSKSTSTLKRTHGKSDSKTHGKVSETCGNAKSNPFDPVVRTNSCSLSSLDLADIDRDLVFMEPQCAKPKKSCTSGCGDADSARHVQVDTHSAVPMDVSAADDTKHNKHPKSTHRSSSGQQVDRVEKHSGVDKVAKNLPVCTVSDVPQDEKLTAIVAHNVEKKGTATTLATSITMNNDDPSDKPVVNDVSERDPIRGVIATVKSSSVQYDSNVDDTEASGAISAPVPHKTATSGVVRDNTASSTTDISDVKKLTPDLDDSCSQVVSLSDAFSYKHDKDCGGLKDDNLVVEHVASVKACSGMSVSVSEDLDRTVSDNSVVAVSTAHVKDNEQSIDASPERMLDHSRVLDDSHVPDDSRPHESNTILPGIKSTADDQLCQSSPCEDRIAEVDPVSPTQDMLDVFMSVTDESTGDRLRKDDESVSTIPITAASVADSVSDRDLVCVEGVLATQSETVTGLGEQSSKDVVSSDSGVSLVSVEDSQSVTSTPPETQTSESDVTPSPMCDSTGNDWLEVIDKSEDAS